MTERGRGTILRVRALSETSLVVHWLSHEQGRMATVAKGARRPKSPFLGRLDLFYTAEFGFRRSTRSELHLLTEVVLREVHAPLRRDLEHLATASYFAQLIEVATETETPIPEVAVLFEQTLDQIALAVQPKMLQLGFEIQLLNLLGLLPPAERVEVGMGSRKIWERLAGLGLGENLGLRGAPGQVLELDLLLRRLISDQFERVPKGRPGVGEG